MSPDSTTYPSPLVRVSFELGPWATPEDPGWQAAYDSQLAAMAGAGMGVYAVLESALAPTPLGQHLAGSDVVAAEGWLTGYLAHAAAVIERFHDRVAAFEVLPQPETSATRGPLVHPQWLAKAMSDLAPAARPASPRCSWWRTASPSASSTCTTCCVPAWRRRVSAAARRV